MNVVIPTGSILITGIAPDLKGYGISWIDTCASVKVSGTKRSAVKLTGADPKALKLRGV
jgi:hypothetical protein